MTFCTHAWFSRYHCTVLRIPVSKVSKVSAGSRKGVGGEKCKMENEELDLKDGGKLEKLKVKSIGLKSEMVEK